MTFFWENPASSFYQGRAAQPGPRFSFFPNRREPNRRWTTKYQNSLPDTAFLIVKPNCGSFKDDRGRTHPLNCRALPIKNRQGNFSCAHLRNAEARANQVEGVSERTWKRAKKRASDLYDKHCR